MSDYFAKREKQMRAAAGLADPPKAKTPRGNPWVAALHAFVDEQELAGSGRRLSDPACRVWHYMHRFADGRNGMSVRVGIPQIARAINRTETTASRLVNELVAAGYLVRTITGRKALGVSRYVVKGRPS